MTTTNAVPTMTLTEFRKNCMDDLFGFMTATLYTRVRNQTDEALNMPQAGPPQNVYSWLVYSDMHNGMSSPEFEGYALPLQEALRREINETV